MLVGVQQCHTVATLGAFFFLWVCVWGERGGGGVMHSSCVFLLLMRSI